MLISDWSSDVCSPDLSCAAAHGHAGVSCHRSTDPAAVFAAIGHDPGAALGLSDDLSLRLLGAAIRAARAGRLASIKRRHFRHEIGRAHVRTPVTNAQLICRPLLEKKKTQQTL